MLVSSVKRSALMKRVAAPSRLARRVAGFVLGGFEECRQRGFLLTAELASGPRRPCRHDLDGGLAVSEHQHALAALLHFAHDARKTLIRFAERDLFHPARSSTLVGRTQQ